jgi:hypothetical protein
MALTHSPLIVTDNLVFCVDAANTKSYSGSGTIWKDISGEDNDGTLVNGPTFSNDNGGSIVFDGTNDYIQLPTNSDLTFTGDFSFEIWLMTDTQLTSNHIWQLSGDKTLQFSSNVSPDQIVYYSSGTGNQAFGVLNNDMWGHLILTKSGNTLTGYLNGAQAWTNTPGSSATHDFSGIRIGSRETPAGYYWDGKFAAVRIYSKGLTAAEVLQNYNTLKGRFL